MRALRTQPKDKTLRRLAIASMPDPTPASGELLVRQISSSLNPVDLETATGAGIAQVLGIPAPLTPGVDVAGEVVAVGPNVTRFAVGDRVLAYTGVPNPRAFAEFVIADQAWAAAWPDTVPDQAAGFLPLVGSTAALAVRLMQLGPDSRVLVLGGAGSVGHLALQLAARTGASVDTTASTHDTEYLQSLGAATVMDYATVDHARQGRVYDALLDTQGGKVLSAALQAVKPGALVVSLKSVPPLDALHAAGIEPRGFLRVMLPLVAGRSRKAVTRAGAVLEPIVTSPDGAHLAELASLVGSGHLTVTTGSAVAFDDLPRTMAAAAGRHTSGRKPVIVF
ncbi:MAG: NADP-dependent oxidoreductase [Actinomycetales bacterium]|nr:NADP-dependent oxidoreductase [Actinomycetales bacterium]